MIIFLDNAESILDPQATNAREITFGGGRAGPFQGYLSLLHISDHLRSYQLRDHKTLNIVDGGCAGDLLLIYKPGERSDLVDGSCNNSTFTHSQSHYWPQSHVSTSGTMTGWSENGIPIVREFFNTDYNESLAATIELSLSSRCSAN